MESISLQHITYNGQQLQKQSASLARILSMQICEFLKGYRSSFQSVVIEKLMGSYLLKDCVLEYLRDLEIVF
jgi:hypothetical protein